MSFKDGEKRRRLLIFGASLTAAAVAGNIFDGGTNAAVEPRRKSKINSCGFRSLMRSVFGENEGVIDFSDFLRELPSLGRILVGEAHFEPTHITAGLEITQALIKRNRCFVLALERFASDEQSELNNFIADKRTNGEKAVDDLFERDTGYSGKWTTRQQSDNSWEYSRLLLWARENGVSLKGVDLPGEGRGGAIQSYEFSIIKEGERDLRQAKRDNHIKGVLTGFPNSVTIIGRPHVQKGYWIEDGPTLAQGLVNDRLKPVLVQQAWGVSNMVLNRALREANVDRVVVVKPERVIVTNGPRRLADGCAADFVVVTDQDVWKSPFADMNKKIDLFS